MGGGEPKPKIDQTADRGNYGYRLNREYIENRGKSIWKHIRTRTEATT